MEALDAILSAHDVLAVLGRDVAVQLVDISGSGCLLHSDTRLVEGTTGTLRLSCGGKDYADDVRIMRCQAPNAGENSFRLGAQFLWTAQPGEQSLRRAVGALQSGTASTLRFESES